MQSDRWLGGRFLGDMIRCKQPILIGCTYCDFHTFFHGNDLVPSNRNNQFNSWVFMRYNLKNWQQVAPWAKMLGRWFFPKFKYILFLFWGAECAGFRKTCRRFNQPFCFKMGKCHESSSSFLDAPNKFSSSNAYYWIQAADQWRHPGLNSWARQGTMKQLDKIFLHTMATLGPLLKVNFFLGYM